MNCTHSIIWQESSCHCMSVPIPQFDALPLRVPVLNLHTHITNYLFTRSIQRNWSLNGLTHIPFSRPTLDHNIAGGEHYFEQRVPGNPFPVISVCFLVCVAIDIEKPIISHGPSSRFPGISIIISSYTIPDYLPLTVEDIIAGFAES